VTERDRLAALHAESERLAVLFDSHGIQWRRPLLPRPAVRERESTSFSTDEKIALFQRLFRGRVDIYPVRWESKTSGKSGYAPACGNEWRPDDNGSIVLDGAETRGFRSSNTGVHFGG